MAAAIAASLRDAGPFSATQPSAMHPLPSADEADTVALEAIQMGFEREQVLRAQASQKFTSTDRLVEHLLLGGRENAPAPAPALRPPRQPSPVALPDTDGDAALAAAVHASLNDIRRESPRGGQHSGREGGSGGSAAGLGGLMDPAHTMRGLVIATLRGDPVARSDMKTTLNGLVQGSKVPTDRLVYFLLENCQVRQVQGSLSPCLGSPRGADRMWVGRRQVGRAGRVGRRAG